MTRPRGTPPPATPSRGEIITAANTRFAALLQECAQAHDEASRQLRQALAMLPDARFALDDYERACAAAWKAFDDEASEAVSADPELEQRARQAQFDADSTALDEWRRATEAVQTRRSDDINAAEAAYTAAYNAASRSGIDRRPEAIATARRTRDAMISQCEHACHGALETARQTYDTAVAASREAAIAAIEDGRARALAASANRTQSLEDGLRRASDSLSESLGRVPLAASVVEAHELRLKSIEEDCEARKAAILAAMRRDLGQ
jgi:hypothetical protein